MPDPASISLAGPLDGFAPISLAEMDAVKLMNRVDTKYLTDRATLADVLRDAAAAGYRVLVADGARISPYDSIYFDTDALRMFTDHRNKKLRRQKVRTRAYVNSGSSGRTTTAGRRRSAPASRWPTSRISGPMTPLAGTSPGIRTSRPGSYGPRSRPSSSGSPS